MRKWQLILIHVCVQILVGSSLILYAYQNNSQSKFDTTDVITYLFSIAGYISISIILIFIIPKVFRTTIIATSFVCFWFWLFAPAYYHVIVKKLNQRKLEIWQEYSIEKEKQNSLKTIQTLGLKNYSWNENKKRIEVKSTSGNSFSFSMDTIYRKLSIYCRFNSNSPCDTVYSLNLMRDAIDVFMPPKAKAKLDSLLKANRYFYKCKALSDYLCIGVPSQTIYYPIQIQAGLVQGDINKTFYCIIKGIKEK